VSDPLERLRALVEASFAPIAAGATPEGVLAQLLARLAACCDELLAASDRAPIPFDELKALADAFRDRSRTLPAEVSRAHFDWLRIDRRWYKLVPGPGGEWGPPPLPPGTLSVPLELVPRVYEAIAELRYALHRRRHPSVCDCAALVARGTAREPSSPELRRVGPGTDGYHVGDEFVCGCCGARWFRGITDDDRGSPFWEPAPGG
jgi:hypothetical protein